MSVTTSDKHSKSITSSLFDGQRFPRSDIQTYQYPSEPSQSYSGWTFMNNLHGHGIYTIQNHKEKIFYDALFYANQVEGYGQIFYEDGSHFQGLFKDNKRFGPGVFTYPTGEQDVGLWNGFSISRLCTGLLASYIPQLVSTASGKAKILQYRKLVPVCPKSEDIALDLMKSFKPRDKIMKQYNKLYNPDIKNKDNVFFNKRLFNDYFHDKEDCTIDVVLSDDDFIEEVDEIMMMNQYEAKIDKLSKRLDQLTVTIKDLEEQLKVIRKEMAEVTAKVNYCRVCCYESESRKEWDCKIPDEVELPKESSIVTDARTNSSTLGSMDFCQSISSSWTTPTKQYDRTTEVYLRQVCICDEEMQVDDLAVLEEKLETLTKQECFLETIRSNLESKRVAIVENLESVQFRIRKVSVKEILAWNNDDIIIEMMKHSFLHRRSENMLTFKVSSILSGQRAVFGDEGRHEQDCNHFLTECYLGTPIKVIEYLRRHNIYVNMTDSKGNSGIFFAVSSNRTDIIKVLVNFGANLDQVNDEGLTPLNLLILTYLSTNYNVVEWENAFMTEISLDDEEEKVIKNWKAGQSCFSMGPDTNRSCKSINEYLWNVSNRQEKKSKSFLNVPRQKTYHFDNSYRTADIVKVSVGKFQSMIRDSTAPKEFLRNVQTNVVDTIVTLLESGADPNVGEVPFPALILSLYSEEESLVRHILEAKADVNVVTPEEGLNCLHIVANLSCSYENIEICNALLDHCCDNNAKTSKNHWIEQKQRVLGNIDNMDEIPDEGKNPLHILCLREDFKSDNYYFFERMASLLIEFGTDVRDCYLGHTPLSLAVLKGNEKLADCLLYTGQIDPYQLLDYNMGNILTLFVLKRYEGILPLEQCKEMLDFLVKQGVNPLRPVGDCENAIEFAQLEQEIKVDVETKKTQPKKTKTINLPKNNPLSIIKEHLKSLSRKMIIKFVEMEASEHLYDLAEEDLLDKDITKVLAEYLTAEVAIENLQLLFSHSRIKAARFDKNLMLKILEFVEENKLVPKKKDVKGKKEKDSGSNAPKKIKSDPLELAIQRREYFSGILSDMNFSEKCTKRDKKLLLKPGLDNALMYKVCFECLKARDKELTPCPRCHFVFYCSEDCNKLNLKSKSGHVCGINVFKEVSQEEDLLELCKKAHDSCVQRYLRKLQAEREEKRRKEEEERKQDVYGTKFLRSRTNTINIYDTASVETRSTLEVVPHKHHNTVRMKLDKAIEKAKYLFSFALDEKLQRLSILEEKYKHFMTKQRWSYRSDSKSQRAASIVREDKGQQKSPKNTIIPKKSDSVQVKNKSRPIMPEVESKFEPLPYFEDPYVTFMKAKNIPKRPQVFIELMGKYFPDFDVTRLTLPYVCHADGHLYYHYKNQDLYTNNFSLL